MMNPKGRIRSYLRAASSERRPERTPLPSRGGTGMRLKTAR